MPALNCAREMAKAVPKNQNYPQSSERDRRIAIEYSSSIFRVYKKRPHLPLPSIDRPERLSAILESLFWKQCRAVSILPDLQHAHLLRGASHLPCCDFT